MVPFIWRGLTSNELVECLAYVFFEWNEQLKRQMADYKGLESSSLGDLEGEDML